MTFCAFFAYVHLYIVSYQNICMFVCMYSPWHRPSLIGNDFRRTFLGFFQQPTPRFSDPASLPSASRDQRKSRGSGSIKINGRGDWSENRIIAIELCASASQCQQFEIDDNISSNKHCNNRDGAVISRLLAVYCRWLVILLSLLLHIENNTQNNWITRNVCMSVCVPLVYVCVCVVPLWGRSGPRW